MVPRSAEADGLRTAAQKSSEPTAGTRRVQRVRRPEVADVAELRPRDAPVAGRHLKGQLRFNRGQDRSAIAMWSRETRPSDGDRSAWRPARKPLATVARTSLAEETDADAGGHQGVLDQVAVRMTAAHELSEGERRSVQGLISRALSGPT